jgi:hypothetical protein
MKTLTFIFLRNLFCTSIVSAQEQELAKIKENRLTAIGFWVWDSPSKHYDEGISLCAV